VGKPEGNRTLGRPRRERECIIKMEPNGIVWEGVNWIHLAYAADRCCEYGDEISCFMKCGKFVD
jgi:hypothetical protein